MTIATTLVSKPRYELLDALRGVAALIVIWYHVFEGFATSPVDQWFNHGYLAVDFFFILSGFVIGYAYDDRWRDGHMTIGKFFKRRLIRLHPMVIVGAVLGAVSFCLQGSKQWDGTAVPLLMVVLALCLNIFMLPVYPGAGPEVRGNGEMFPLNGPNWSLFFEYVGNILYAIFVRRLSTRWLAILTGLCGVLVVAVTTLNLSGFYHMGVGWTVADYGFWGGFVRLMFSFSAGMLMSRVIKPKAIKHAFWICTLILLAFLAVPHVGTDAYPWLNGIYDSFCIIVVFPLVLYIGASAKKSSATKTSDLLGRISYPLYAIHYPMMYLFYAWLWSNSLSFSQTWHVAVAIFFGSIIIAYLFVKYYDEPVRRWLTDKFK